MRGIHDQAFPRAGFDGPDHSGSAYGGMHMIEYFAAQAMPIAHQMLLEKTPYPSCAAVAGKAYELAEAMIDTGNKYR